MQQPEDPPRPSPADVVLNLSDLLDEILLRLDIPAFLVLASQASTLWRSRATDPAFLDRFRKRLARRPRPLGFYLGSVDPNPHGRTKFVHMSQRAELAGVVSRANFGRFDAHNADPGQSARVLGCRNGRVLLNLLRYGDGPYAVLSPLGEAPGAMALLPPLQPPLDDDDDDEVVLRFLPDDGGDGTSCLVVSMSSLPHKQEAVVCLSLLQDGSWVNRISCTTGLSAPLGFCLDQLLVRNKIYMLFSNGYGYIVRLDLDSIRFLVIELPDGVELVTMENAGVITQRLSRADDSGVYFIQVRGTQLCVWLCKIDGDNAGIWMLEDRFSLYKAFGHLANLIWQADNESGEVLHVFGAGDNAEFVFLIDGDAFFYDRVFYLNIRTRKVEVVYNKLSDDDDVLDICPFMMV